MLSVKSDPKQFRISGKTGGSESACPDEDVKIARGSRTVYEAGKGTNTPVPASDE